jgi:hypothetical protein
MRIEYFVETPETRKFAELAIDFVTRVVKREALNKLAGIAVVEARKTYEDTEKVVMEACKAIDAPPIGCQGTRSDIYKVFSELEPENRRYGAYLPGRVEGRPPVIIWMLPRRATPNAHDSYVLFHEIGHHMIYAYYDDAEFTERWIADALAGDIGFVKLLNDLYSLEEEPLIVPGRGIIAEELVKLRAREIQELEKRIRDVVMAFIYLVNEVAATTIGANYFLLLNTQPYPRPIMFGYLHIFDIGTNEPFKALIDLIGVIKYIVLSFNTFPKSAVNRIVSEIDAIIDRFLSSEMGRFVIAVHNVFESCITTMPKNVYMQEPDKYAPLFIGLDWSIIMSLIGLPVMDKRW